MNPAVVILLPPFYKALCGPTYSAGVEVLAQFAFEISLNSWYWKDFDAHKYAQLIHSKGWKYNKCLIPWD